MVQISHGDSKNMVDNHTCCTASNPWDSRKSFNYKQMEFTIYRYFLFNRNSPSNALEVLNVYERHSKVWVLAETTHLNLISIQWIRIGVCRWQTRPSHISWFFVNSISETTINIWSKQLTALLSSKRILNIYFSKRKELNCSYRSKKCVTNLYTHNFF